MRVGYMISTPERRFLTTFRPTDGAMDLEGVASPDHYWWLAYDWDNLYLAHPSVISQKQGLFPVIGKRAAVNATIARCRKERALLLDPCFDQPADYLVFGEDGQVRPAEPLKAGLLDPYGKYHRGRVSIDVYGLNVENLVTRRKRRAASYTRLLGAFDPSSGPKDQIYGPLRAEGAFTGMHRQLFAQLIRREYLASRSPKIRRALLRHSEAVQIEYDAIVSREHLSKLRKPALKKRKAARATAKPPVGEQVPPKRLTTTYLSEVEIHNFKAIHHLEISLVPWQDSARESETLKSDSLSTDGNWRMLLGENASGKSTVLSAIAMALMGQDHLPDRKDKTSRLAHEFKPERILRRRARSGFVRLRLSHEPEDFFMRFTKNGIRYEGPPRDFSMFLRAYGAVRLLPGPVNKAESKGEQAIKIVNLFDPFQPLVDAEQWLLGLDEKLFGAAAMAIKDLLNREEGEVLTRSGDKVRLDGDPLDDISDGYRSVVAMACDIMAGHPHSLHDMQQATGIVLIDEIGAHLHPQWKMRVVARFREAFRGIQFIVTTHEPLCLRGLRTGEVCLMEREKQGHRRVSLRTDLPSPEHMRVDQLLTSSIFGMESTIDPALDAQFAAYYRLLAKTRPSAEERVKLEAYRKDLKGVGVLGYTRRDQMVYEIIDDFLARAPKLGKVKREQMKRETRERVQALWDYAKLKAKAEDHD